MWRGLKNQGKDINAAGGITILNSKVNGINSRWNFLAGAAKGEGFLIVGERKGAGGVRNLLPNYKFRRFPLSREKPLLQGGGEIRKTTTHRTRK